MKFTPIKQYREEMDRFGKNIQYMPEERRMENIQWKARLMPISDEGTYDDVFRQ